MEMEAHSHSPRRKASLGRPALPPPSLGPMLPPGISAFPRNLHADPFIEPLRPWRQSSSTDISMPDYSSSASWASHSRRVTDPMMTDKQERRYDTLQSHEAFETICEALLPSAPDNTPQNGELEEAGSALDFQKTAIHAEADCFPGRLRSSKDVIVTTNEPLAKYETPDSNPMPVLNSDFVVIKSRKENIQEYSSTCERHGSIDRTRKSMQSVASTSSCAKRQRVVTPASFKAIDEEDEPRSSPTRKASQGVSAQDRGRRALSGIELNIL